MGGVLGTPPIEAPLWTASCKIVSYTEKGGVCKIVFSLYTLEGWTLG
jgi:hypothetical protein